MIINKKNIREDLSHLLSNAICNDKEQNISIFANDITLKEFDKNNPKLEEILKGLSNIEALGLYASNYMNQGVTASSDYAQHITNFLKMNNVHIFLLDSEDINVGSQISASATEYKKSKDLMSLIELSVKKHLENNNEVNLINLNKDSNSFTDFWLNVLMIDGVNNPHSKVILIPTIKNLWYSSYAHYDLT